MFLNDFQASDTYNSGLFLNIVFYLILLEKWDSANLLLQRIEITSTSSNLAMVYLFLVIYDCKNNGN